ncbi:MAG: dynamin family protein [Ilumatobacter sp.]|uniref:dynamin family protein n=1 Tax=Ilumatobacter sp. TaxID=1967498 RepID=UPI00391CD138
MKDDDEPMVTNDSDPDATSSNKTPDDGSKDGGSNADVLAVVENGIAAATAYGRPDLASRLQATRARLLETSVNVVVIGEFKQGKSSLINALLNAEVCPVDDDIATAVPTSIRHGAERSAAAVLDASDGAREDDRGDEGMQRRPIEFGQIAEFATERASDLDADLAGSIRGVEVRLNRRLLETGLVLVDTPGVGGLGSAHATAALGALSVADAAIFLSDASQEYTQTEMGFLRQALEMCPHVVCVMTKTDFYPAWRKVQALNDGHLRDAGYDLPTLPVSSMLRLEAIRRNDKTLNAESGFPELITRLSDDIVAGAAHRERTIAQADLLAVTEHLSGQFEAELSALNDPVARAEQLRRLEEATARSERLRSQAARWSVTLNDGVADLTSNVDFDFRERIRQVTTEADAAIANSDPLETWAEFEPWLAERVSFEVVSNYRYLTESSLELSRTVAQHFELDGGEVLAQLDISNPTTALSRVNVDTSIDLDAPNVRAKGMTALRGSYSGVLMFTMLGTMIGVAPLTPIVVGIGLVMGRKGLKDEKERQQTQRRGQARTAVRKYCDDVTFQVGKDSRDTLRRTQRKIRDFYTARAEEVHRSTTEALSAAKQAAQTGEQERSGRLRDVEAELARLATLRERAQRLLPASSTTEVGR